MLINFYVYNGSLYTVPFIVKAKYIEVGVNPAGPVGPVVPMIDEPDKSNPLPEPVGPVFAVCIDNGTLFVEASNINPGPRLLFNALPFKSKTRNLSFVLF